MLWIPPTWRHLGYDACQQQQISFSHILSLTARLTVTGRQKGCQTAFGDVIMRFLFCLPQLWQMLAFAFTGINISHFFHQVVRYSFIPLTTVLMVWHSGMFFIGKKKKKKLCLTPVCQPVNNMGQDCYCHWQIEELTGTLYISHTWSSKLPNDTIWVAWFEEDMREEMTKTLILMLRMHLYHTAHTPLCYFRFFLKKGLLTEANGFIHAKKIHVLLNWCFQHFKASLLYHFNPFVQHVHWSNRCPSKG